MPRYCIVIQYEGTAYWGWQKQPHFISIQSELERVFFQIMRYPITIFGQGRTDRGVHAIVQTAHFNSLPIKNTNDFLYRINSLLPNDIYITHIKEVSPMFHARYSALSRTYCYRITTDYHVLWRNHILLWRYSLDHEKIQQATKRLIGTYNFQKLSKKNKQQPNTNCTILSCMWDISRKPQYIFSITANRFLRHMVIRIMGLLLAIGQNYISLSHLNNLLQFNTPLPYPLPVIPPHGLTLSHV